jgi:hypothetical protein
MNRRTSILAETTGIKVTPDIAKVVLMADWSTSSTDNGVTARQLLNEDDWTQVKDWLASLNDVRAYAVYFSFTHRRKKPLPSWPKEYAEPWEKWVKTQYSLEGIQRGEASVARKDETGIENWRDLLTPEEVAKAFPGLGDAGQGDMK